MNPKDILISSVYYIINLMNPKDILISSVYYIMEYTFSKIIIFISSEYSRKRSQQTFAACDKLSGTYGNL
jgi:hypothetical protein